MAELTAGFDKGVHGNNVLTSDTGDATVWTGTPASAALIYDNTRESHGSLSGKFTIQAGRTVFFWSMSETDHYGRAYLYNAAFQTVRIIDAEAAGGVRQARISLGAAGNVNIQDAGVNTLNTTKTYLVNQWIRLEWHVVHSATVGQIEVKLFNPSYAIVPIETLTSPATWNTGAASVNMVFGQLDSDGNDGQEIWWDGILVGATSYPGPISVPTHMFHRRILGGVAS